jgi:hypothetical protein
LTASSNIMVLQELIRNSAVCKYAHFKAADRIKRLVVWFGAPVVIINVTLGSIFFYSLNQNLPNVTKWIGAALALLAASLSALQTYFNFSRAFEAHRTIANEYNALLRECELLEAAFNDGLIQLSDLSEKIKLFMDKYNEINEGAESFSPNRKDYNEALIKAKERVERKLTRRDESNK